MTNQDAVRTGSVGVIASMFTWLIGVVNWYSFHLRDINDWLVHLAQLGGLVVVFLSIMILRRNWKNGSQKLTGLY